MVTSLWKKRLRPFFLVYLALIVIVSFSFSMHDKICNPESGSEVSGTDNFFSSIYNFDSVDWLSENSTVMRRASEYSSCQMRYGLLRIFGLAGFLFAAIVLFEPGCNISKKDKASIQKNNIPLKLRI